MKNITTIIGGSYYRNFLITIFFILTLFTLTPNTTNAQSFTTNDFITTWDTTKAGTSTSTQITIPGTGAGYSYSIYWESLSSSTATGTIATSTSASQTISFPEPGEYKVAIKGTYPRIYFNNTGDKLKILTVEQWGIPAWTSMTSAFYGCANLTVPATDAPNLSGVTSLNSMFFGASSFNQPIDHWDVYGVKDMANMFRDATAFNQPLNSWNVSEATSIRWMFLGTSFNQPLDNWDVSKVTTIRAMFANSPFNQDISMWNTASNTDLSYLFQNNTYFNQDISNWNTSNVTQMEGTFINSEAFNYDLSSWNTASVTNMKFMFRDDESFNQDLSAWNIANVTTMDQMFLNAGLSTANLDSTLQSWSAQSLHQNVPFHLGLKTYSSTGESALTTLRNTYNWTITEQYQAEYQEGEDYTISGTTTQSHVSHGSTTTAVEVIPNNRCTFLKWSDDNTDNPRTDTLTDNLTLTAITKCASPSSGNSSNSRYQKLLELGNTTEAEAIKDKYLTPTNSTSLSTAITIITTLTTNPAITNNPQTRQQLITILIQLVKVLEGMRGG